LATKALDEVRREYWNALRHAGQDDTAKQFKHDRWALLKNPAQLTDRQAVTLAAIRAGGGKVARAWAMKEMVRAIFASGLTVEARSASCSTGSWPASPAAGYGRSSAWAKRSASTERASSQPDA
jgi:hypothetical protein